MNEVTLEFKDYKTWQVFSLQSIGKKCEFEACFRDCMNYIEQNKFKIVKQFSNYEPKT